MAKIMQRTVFVEHDGKRERLVRGTDAPDWYDGSAAGDELATVRDTIAGPVGNHPALATKAADAETPTTAEPTAPTAPTAPTPQLTDMELLDGTAQDVLDRVGDDRDLAQRALTAEMAAAKPRTTLTDALTKRLGQ